MKKPVIAVCPCDDNNLVHFEKLKNSLRKFHSEEELPLIRADLSDLPDSQRWYKATPFLASHHLKDYDCVLKLDADQIVTGDISAAWTGEFDVATVLNDPTYKIPLWDIQTYFNCGLVAIRSMEFAEHWWSLCQSEHFDRYQFREQDLLNILCSYGNYDVNCLDGDIIYGESAKPLWATARLVNDKLMIGDKQLNVIHFGGGNSADKGNYKIRFEEGVVKWLDQLVKP